MPRPATPEPLQEGPPGSDDDVLAGLTRVLDLEQTGEDTFVGQSQPQPLGRVFGGQVLGQALVAAGRTTPPERLAHSMHGYFLRPGRSSAPITFSVEQLRDGRSFSARRTQATQDGVPILSMIASFQRADTGLDHQSPMPDVPPPEDLPTAEQLLGHIDDPTAQHWARQPPVDIRHIQAPVFLTRDPERVPAQAVWMRAIGPLPDDDLLHRAVLAYASDFTLLEPVMRGHGVARTTTGLKVASLDHAMWWHRPVRADQWLLYLQSSPSAQGGRGLGIGRIHSRDGTMVASVAQEGMLRIPTLPRDHAGEGASAS